MLPLAIEDNSSSTLSPGIFQDERNVCIGLTVFLLVVGQINKTFIEIPSKQSFEFSNPIDEGLLFDANAIENIFLVQKIITLLIN